MQTIHLQSVGKMPAQPAKNVKAGTKIMWNFGYVYQILEVTKETDKMIFVKTQSVEGGKIYERKYLKTRLVAIL